MFPAQNLPLDITFEIKHNPTIQTPFLGPLAAIWILQVIHCCSQCGIEGGVQVPLAPVGWY